MQDVGQCQKTTYLKPRDDGGTGRRRCTLRHGGNAYPLPEGRKGTYRNLYRTVHSIMFSGVGVSQENGPLPTSPSMAMGSPNPIW
jgi:hypothetical protein